MKIIPLTQIKKIVLQVWEVLELGSSEIKRNRGSITLYKQQQGWVQNWVRSRKMEPMLLGNKLLKTYHESVFGERQATGERGHLVLPRTYFETHCFVLWLKMQHTFFCIGT